MKNILGFYFSFPFLIFPVDTILRVRSLFFNVAIRLNLHCRGTEWNGGVNFASSRARFRENSCDCAYRL